METWVWVLIILAVIVVVGAAAWYWQKRRTAQLRERFGPEYEHTVQEYGDRRQAEAELAARERRVEQLRLHSLSAEERGRFSERWKAAQARFVDNPAVAIAEADQLIQEVMQARGYPVGDFEQRAADISAEHPQVVDNYRTAHRIAEANERGEASTEELRQAMMHYRALFNEELAEIPQPEGRKVG